MSWCNASKAKDAVMADKSILDDPAFVRRLRKLIGDELNSWSSFPALAPEDLLRLDRSVEETPRGLVSLTKRPLLLANVDSAVSTSTHDLSATANDDTELLELAQQLLEDVAGDQIGSREVTTEFVLLVVGAGCALFAVGESLGRTMRKNWRTPTPPPPPSGGGRAVRSRQEAQPEGHRTGDYLLWWWLWQQAQMPAPWQPGAGLRRGGGGSPSGAGGGVELLKRLGWREEYRAIVRTYGRVLGEEVTQNPPAIRAFRDLTVRYGIELPQQDDVNAEGLPAAVVVVVAAVMVASFIAGIVNGYYDEKGSEEPGKFQ
jgi:hypothetical protein